jgi:hypothetical protein
MSIPLSRLVTILIYKYTKDEMKYIVSPRRQFGGGLMRPSVSEHATYAK